MDPLALATIQYSAVMKRLRAEDPQIDDRTLADTVEGLSDLPDILTAILRAALTDEALAQGLKSRIVDMETRLARLKDRASKRRHIVKDAMINSDLKKLTAPDFTATIRAGTAGLLVLDEAAVPSIFWEPREPRLNRQELISNLKQGTEITGVALSNPEPVLSVRTK